jgi:hypothetical protein
LLRTINDRAAFRLLLSRGALTRGQLGELTGLSKPTAMQMLDRIQAAKLVLLAGESVGRPGPNAQLYAVNPAAAYVAGIDVQPTQLTVEIADVTGAAISTVDLKHRKSADPAVVAQQVLAAATEQAGLGIDDLSCVVLVVPGVPDPRLQAISYADSVPQWETPGVLDRVRTALGVPVIAENDVNLAAMAERARGSAADTDGFALLWLSDGLGLAIASTVSSIVGQPVRPVRSATCRCSVRTVPQATCRRWSVARPCWSSPSRPVSRRAPPVRRSERRSLRIAQSFWLPLLSDWRAGSRRSQPFLIRRL